jgi:cytochrome c oxidase subunit IV
MLTGLDNFRLQSTGLDYFKIQSTCVWDLVVVVMKFRAL